jgi:hypothetical protein
MPFAIKVRLNVKAGVYDSSVRDRDPGFDQPVSSRSADTYSVLKSQRGPLILSGQHCQSNLA